MYKEMYFHLFNAITDAIELLEQQEFQKALDCLARAQRHTEETYIDDPAAT